jgi:hypothetical protein
VDQARGGAVRRLLTVVLAAGIGILTPATVRADQAESEQLQAYALAEGVRIGNGMPGFLIVEQFVDGGGPVAETLTNALGVSRAFASLPYPGDNAITGPGTAAGLAGTPSPPAYPFYAASAYPTKTESTFGQDGWKLKARSDERSSSAVASAGATGGQASFLGSQAGASSTREETGGAAAQADTRVEGFRIGDVLSVNSVVASAAAKRGTGAIERQSTFHVQGLFVGGQEVGIGPKGLTYPGQSAPLPDSGPLLDALRQQGITVTYLEATEEPEGVRSAGLVIVQEVKSPSGHTVRTTYTLGRAVARVTSLAADE